MRAGLRGGLFIFLEKELAALRHLFLAKNEKTTPRRRALAGSRLKRRVRENPKLNLLTGC
jgi:phage-related protein